MAADGQQHAGLLQPSTLEVQDLVASIVSDEPGIGAIRAHRAVESAMPSWARISDKRVRKLVREAKLKAGNSENDTPVQLPVPTRQNGGAPASQPSERLSAAEEAKANHSSGGGRRRILALGVDASYHKSMFQGIQQTSWSMDAEGVHETWEGEASDWSESFDVEDVKIGMGDGLTTSQAESALLDLVNGFSIDTYQVIVVTEDYFDCYFDELSSKMVSCYGEGCTIIVLAASGIFAFPKRMSDLFGCKWSFNSNDYITSVPTDACLKRFPGVIVNDATRTGGHKCTRLRCPEEEAMFAPRIDESADEEYIEYLQQEKYSLVPFAVHIGAQGECLAWFSAPLDTVFAPYFKGLCLAARNVAPPSSPSERRGGVGDVSETAVECLICLSVMTGNTALAQIQPCGHQYHMTCIADWKGTCPSCRGLQQGIVNLALGTLPRTSFPAFAIGRRVRLIGLVKSPGLNGRLGTVLSFDEAQGRYAVEKLVAYPEEGAKSYVVKVKEENLEPVLGGDQLSLSELQELVNALPAGSRVRLPRGDIKPAGGGAAAVLTVGRAITLDGKGQAVAGGTTLHCSVQVQVEGEGGALQLSNFRTTAPMVISGPGLLKARLLRLTVHVNGGNADALTLQDIGAGPVNIWSSSSAWYEEGRTFLKDCEIIGGSDGVFIKTDGCVLKGCSILGAQSRGIFADPDFVVEGCTVQGCGGYGMKTRGGVTRRGENDIQPGPWDSFMG